MIQALPNLIQNKPCPGGWCKLVQAFNMAYRQSMFFLLLIFVLMLPGVSTQEVMAATYYIDYEAGSDQYSGKTQDRPWKRCPGMVGFKGEYQHRAGDVFVFKGGVVWPKETLPLTIGYSGSADSEDVYRADRSWHKGQAWGHPVFDAEGETQGYAGVIQVRSRSNIKINGLKIFRVGRPGVASKGRAMILHNISNIEVQNCIFQIYGNHGVVIGVTPTEAYANISIHNNTFSNAANFIEIGLTTAGNNALRNLYIFNNTFKDSRSNLIAGDHGDGVHIFCKNGAPRVKNVKIYGNRWVGDFGSSDAVSSNTAQVYLEDSVDGGEIYNNIFSFENTKTEFNGYLFTPGFIAIYGCKNIKIYNNTLVSDAIATSNFGALAGVALSMGLSNTCENIDIRNNIFSKPRLGIVIPVACRNVSSDYNFFNPRREGYVGAVGNSFKTLSGWKAAGYDMHGDTGDPLFVSLSPPFNLMPDYDSPVIDAGDNTGESYASDIEGTYRPTGNGWDVGAYEVKGSPKVSPPKNLRIVQPE
jgi:hypothetical protein